MPDPEDDPALPEPLPVPLPSPRFTSLAEILAAITPENMHPEFDFGPPVGAELL